MGAFDTLDDAAGSVAKLNIVFGTTISSLDMMMTQDPAERFELVRQQLLSQGKTYDQLGRAEMQMLTSTLKLSEDEVAAMLDRYDQAVKRNSEKAQDESKRFSLLQAMEILSEPDHPRADRAERLLKHFAETS